jgi:hypothetical protein
MFFSVVSVVSVVSVLLLASFFAAPKEKQILRHENARSALECGIRQLTDSYRLLIVQCKAAAPLRFAAALQGASRIFMHGGEPKDHEVCAQDDMSF